MDNSELLLAGKYFALSNLGHEPADFTNDGILKKYYEIAADDPGLCADEVRWWMDILSTDENLRREWNTLRTGSSECTEDV